MVPLVAGVLAADDHPLAADPERPDRRRLHLRKPPLDPVRALGPGRRLGGGRGQGEAAAQLDGGDLVAGGHRRERRGVEPGGDEVGDPERLMGDAAGGELGEEPRLLLAGGPLEARHHEPPLLGPGGQRGGGGEIGLFAEDDERLGAAVRDGGEQRRLDLPLPAARRAGRRRPESGEEAEEEKGEGAEGTHLPAV